MAELPFLPIAASPAPSRLWELAREPVVPPGQASVGNAGSYFMPLDTTDPTARAAFRMGIGQTEADTSRLWRLAEGAAGFGGVTASQRASQMERHLSRMGFDVTPSRSNISESRYLELLPPLGSDGPSSVKVRISNHDLPPSYPRPDFDVDVQGARADGQEWYSVLRAIAERAGVNPPAAVRAAETRAASRAAADAAAQQQSAARSAEIAADRSAQDARVATAFPTEWNDAMRMAGASRREALRLLRRQFERREAGDG